MSRNKTLILAAVVMAALAVLVVPTFSKSSVGNEIAKTDIEFCKATQEKGLEGWTEYFSDNAVLGQFSPPAKGKDGVRRAYAKLFSRSRLDFKWSL